MKTILGMVACANKKEARTIAKNLLEKRLAVCVNILPQKAESHYWWKRKIEKSTEVFLFFKTKENLVRKAILEIKRTHSYELPVIEFWKTRLNKEAKKWVEKETNPAKKIAKKRFNPCSQLFL